MRILFIAPEICTPYTEGRKRFVLDLIERMSRLDQIFLLTTTRKGEKTLVPVPFRSSAFNHGMGHLLFPALTLKSAIIHFKPNVVCLFPYSTFRGFYGYASFWFMSQIDRTCRQNGVPCLTIMYAIDNHSTPQSIRSRVSNLAISQKSDWNGAVVNVGIRYDHWPALPPKDNGGSKLLFLAGMWQQTMKRVEHIIQVRGLGNLLSAGKSLSANGVRIIIAAPLFASDNCRKYLHAHPLNTWPKDKITLLSTVNVPEIYRMSDLFVFPYQKNIFQFIPSSVIESMLAGTCVTLSDLPFLRPLAQEGKTACLFPPNNIEGMVEVLINLLNNRQQRLEMARSARQYARDNWSIDTSVMQIRQLCSALYK